MPSKKGKTIPRTARIPKIRPKTIKMRTENRKAEHPIMTRRIKTMTRKMTRMIRTMTFQQQSRVMRLWGSRLRIWAATT